MVIWKAEGEDVMFFEKKGEAHAYLRSYRKEHGRNTGVGPEKVTIKGRAELVALLNGQSNSAAEEECEFL